MTTLTVITVSGCLVFMIEKQIYLRIFLILLVPNYDGSLSRDFFKNISDQFQQPFHQWHGQA
jgi:hypothetical protein